MKPLGDDDRHEDGDRGELGDRRDGRRLRWRSYAEDMGNDPARDYGTPDDNA
jgi:hypothetical protein